MKSDTKLSREQKAERKQMLAELVDLGGSIGWSSTGRVTVALLSEFPGPTCRISLMAVSVASPQEKKFRRKVGEYLALSRLFDGNAIKVPGGSDPSSLADILDV